MGDFNAYNDLWGSNDTDERGREVEQFRAHNNINVINNGDGAYCPIIISYSDTQIHTTAEYWCIEKKQDGIFMKLALPGQSSLPKSKKQQVNPLTDCHLLFLHKLIFHVTVLCLCLGSSTYN